MRYLPTQLSFIIFCLYFLSACGIDSQTEESSSRLSGFGSFASKPILDELEACDIFAKPWNRGCEIDTSDLDLEAISNIDPEDIPYLETRVSLSKEDIENAIHTCDGDTCEAVVDKPMHKLVEVLNVEIPITVQMSARIKYEKSETEDESGLYRLNIGGEYKAVHIARFVHVGVSFGVKLDTEMNAEKAFTFKQPDFYCEANVGVDLPFVDLMIKINENGIEFNNKIKIKNQFGVISAGNPFANSIKFDLTDLNKFARDIGNEMINSPKYNPDDPSYGDHLFDRIDDLYGFGA
jgi:hypothetical protein